MQINKYTVCLSATAVSSFHPRAVYESPFSAATTLQRPLVQQSLWPLGGDFGPDPSFVSRPAVSSVSTAGLAASANTSVLNAEILYVEPDVTASPPPLSLSRSSSDRFVRFAKARLIMSGSEGGEGGTERQRVRLHLCDWR